VARSTEQLVEEIRQRRRAVRAELRSLGSVDEIERRIRSAPGWWIGGAALVGMVTARFFAPQMLRAGKRQLWAMVWGRLRPALFAAGVAAVTGRPSAVPEEEPADAHPGSMPSSHSS
jgi:membrane-associated phospholipid phosphatase